MAKENKIYGAGILKNSARELSYLVDEEGNTWICDKESVKNVDPTKPFSQQDIDGCQIMPFDHGG